MSEEKPALISPLGTAIKFGLAMGVLLIIYLYFTTRKTIEDNHSLDGNYNILNLLMVLVPIVLAILEHRRKFAGRPMRITEGLGAGVITVFIGGAIAAVFLFIYYYGNSDVMQALEKISLKENPGTTQNIIEAGDFKKAILACLSFYMLTFMVGFILSLISSLFLFKRKA
ncbi:MAG: DUF4199 domain-containing protein [Bacteroidota bacterium]|nr:DUF4199 domain-containing protein [Bacteroidota bacterium]